MTEVSLPTNMLVVCKKCDGRFYTAETPIDRIVLCPKGHPTVVRAKKSNEDQDNGPRSA